MYTRYSDTGRQVTWVSKDSAKKGNKDNQERQENAMCFRKNNSPSSVAKRGGRRDSLVEGGSSQNGLKRNRETGESSVSQNALCASQTLTASGVFTRNVHPYGNIKTLT